MMGARAVLSVVAALSWVTSCSQPQVKGAPEAAAEDAAAPKPPPVTRDACEDYEANNIQVFKKVAPATVFITQKRLVQDFWSMRQAEVEAGTGSGFVWDADGHIVTNYHVIDQGSSFIVKLMDGTEQPASFVGGDPNKDVAVLKIDPSKAKDPLVPVTLRDAGSTLEVGQTTIAIGNPFGLDHTLTVGVVSALGREVTGFGGLTIRGVIQTDASINPGNSGGPLLNRRGELIGMNTMIYTKVGQSAGIGFAVPVTILRRVVPQLIKYGKTRSVGIGIQIVSDRLAQRAGIRGVVIQAVIRGGPAQKAGLQGLRRTVRGVVVGDVIIGIDAEQIDNYDDYYNALDLEKPGDTVSVTIDRNGKQLKVDVEVALED